jgi:hypothetical protein
MKILHQNPVGLATRLFSLIAGVGLFLTFDVRAQEQYVLISRTVVDQETGKSVPFAHVSFSGVAIGTASDSEGMFTLRIERNYFKDSLRVSSIGYLTRTVAVAQLMDASLPVISLEPDVRLLDEVVIKEAPVDPVEIVRSVIRSFSANYCQTPFTLEYHSDIVAIEHASQKRYRLETVLQGYSEGYGSSQRKRFQVIHKRETGEDFLKSIDYSYWPSFEIHTVDQIASSVKIGVLNEKSLAKFNLKYAGVSLFDSDTVYQIEYVLPKPTKEITGYGIVPKTYRGTLFITTRSHALVKHEVEDDHFSYRIIYKKMGDYYFPYHISGDRHPAGIRLVSKVQNTLTLKRINTENVTIVNSPTNEFGSLESVEYDEAFWATNYAKE